MIIQFFSNRLQCLFCNACINRVYDSLKEKDNAYKEVIPHRHSLLALLWAYMCLVVGLSTAEIIWRQ
jgi:hypothetical protein